MGRCPRCGLEGDLVERVVRGRTYYYMKHYLGKDERGWSRYRWCYLGPAEYEYATRTHARELMVFRGMLDEGRVLRYLEAAAANAAARVRECAGVEERMAEVLRMSEEARARLASAENPREKAALERDVEALEREKSELEEERRRCHEARVALARVFAIVVRLAAEDRGLADLVARYVGERLERVVRPRTG